MFSCVCKYVYVLAFQIRTFPSTSLAGYRSRGASWRQPVHDKSSIQLVFVGASAAKFQGPQVLLKGLIWG